MASFIAAMAAAQEAKKTYIVRMDKSAMPVVFPTHEHWYKSLVSSITEEENTNLIYTYDHALHGFAAKLTKAQVEALARVPGHLSVHEERRLQLQTTRSPKFLGLSPSRGIWPQSGFGNDVIIGMIDTGVWPESESFNDRGLTDVPTRWKGNCQAGEAFNSSNCNKKLIGARYFVAGLNDDEEKKNEKRTIEPPPDGFYKSPRDSDGHGTHTASTAAGQFVPNADYFGYAKGTAAGVAPGARLAVYKVCNVFCSDSDIVAAIDQAIKDGVDILSMSLGSLTPEKYIDDMIGQAAFGAMEKGVLPVLAAGNSGSDPGSVVNVAPWVVTVGASSIDRQFQAEVTLGNGNVVVGNSYYVLNETLYNVPLVHITNNEATKACDSDSLPDKLVSGKIIVCTTDINRTVDTDWQYILRHIQNQLTEANRAGAAAAIIINYNAPNPFPDAYFMPALVVGPAEGKLLTSYAATSNATADIVFQITSLNTKPAPVVPDFSGRGPSVPSPGILKPDVVAPGVDILAAYPPNIPVITVGSDNMNLSAQYYLDSGTSMATPHVAGSAALVKAIHPGWSPAAIHSALMTTAMTNDNIGQSISQLIGINPIPFNGSPFDFGAGHIRPNLAADPGLVYDAGVEDYLDFLCTLNLTAKEIQTITGKKYSCRPHLSATDLNCPSFSAIFDRKVIGKQVVTFHRTVTNVGDGNSVYRAVIRAPRGVNVQVKPDVLKFRGVNEKLSFVVRMEMEVKKTMVKGKFMWYGYLTWVDGNHHRVQSPLVAFFST
ncbi:hypothetical protein SUGI_0975810 [Cryptomeria japonica]|uniref:subtilisin-like protease SBT1.5 n=1 Tax=Cryptomeria japonica TaxID=3369 RepID=UPI002414BC17|nr:subtilisin-like protease SBT1.5 [Cryptomeria japonica]GLJ46296.1 hypothetical protein SUGI_0975810 [Cryptomeria japonica]